MQFPPVVLFILGLGLLATGLWLFRSRAQADAPGAKKNAVLSRMHAVLQGSPDAIVGMDDAGSIVFWNDAAEVMFGLPSSQAVGLDSKGLLQALGMGERATTLLRDIQSDLDKAASESSRRVAEATLQHRDGTALQVEMSLCRHADDADWATTVYVRDVGVHKRNQSLLEAARRQLLDVTDNLPVAVYQFRMVDGKSFFPFANQYWSNMGLPPELVMSDPSHVFVLNHPDDWDGVKSSIQEAVASGSVWRKEMRIRFPDGNYRWMLGCSKPIPHPDGGVIFNGYWQDIHEAKLQAIAVEEAQVAAETARQQLLDMTDGLPLTVFQLWLNHAGRVEFLFVSSNSATVIGVEAQALLQDANQCWNTAIAEDRTNASAALQAALNGGMPCNLEYRVQFGGAVRWIRAQALPAQSEGGTLIWNGFWMDETDARSNMDAMRLAKDLAEEATRTKSTFLATMSHEIRTPMNAIIGMSHLALQHSMDAKARGFVEKVNRAGNSLLGIINDILDFSKMEAERMELERVDFALDAVMDNVRNLIGMKAEEKGLQLRFHVASSVPPLLVGDPLRLGQVLINLGNNAVKFTEHGFVDIGVQVEAQQGDEIVLHFSVHDSGIGMSEEQCTRLFQAFSQADGSTTRKYGGTGLGLAISKRLIELMGGDLSVQSVLGQGSVFGFRVTLGVSAATDLEHPLGALDKPGARRAVAAASAQSARARLRGVRLLLVEDNEMNQELAMELLSNAGAQVTLAVHGAQALEILGTGQTFDGVLMDCQMPVMDGYTATRQLRQNPQWAHLPVIAMTANVMAGDLEKAMAAGMNAHVSKPLNVAEMFATIAHWVRPEEGRELSDSVLLADERSDIPGSDQTEPALPLFAGIDTQKGLAHTDHNVNLYRRQLLSFLRNQQDFAARFQEAVAQQDWETATRHAHTLKGTAGAIGAVTLQQAAAQLEQCCAERQTVETVLPLSSATIQLLQAVVGELASWSDQEATTPTSIAMDLETLKALLRDLDAKCESSDPDAAEIASELLKASGGQPYEALARQLNRALENFDFDEATGILHKLHPLLDSA